MMNPILADADIPTYPLEMEEGNTHRFISILEADGQRNLLREEFLLPHRKDFYLLAYVKQGSNRHWIDMTPYTLHPHNFYFSVPEQVHLKEEARPMTGTLIGFTKEFLALDDSQQLRKLPLIQNPQNGHELRLSAADREFIEDILAKLSTEYNRPQDWQQEMLLGYMRVLLIYLSRLYTQQFSSQEVFADRQMLKKFQASIEENYQELHEVAAYADRLNITAGHLNHLVKAQSGKTAMEHIHARLLLEAKRLLFHTQESIKEIAFALGFEDASYFNRFFKRLTDKTPLAYRNAIREMYH
ncbi:MAG: helix-turn-helix transcriptional regulator [Cyclobacteriaceae bacterium]